MGGQPRWRAPPSLKPPSHNPHLPASTSLELLTCACRDVVGASPGQGTGGSGRSAAAALLLLEGAPSPSLHARSVQRGGAVILGRRFTPEGQLLPGVWVLQGAGCVWVGRGGSRVCVRGKGDAVAAVCGI